MVCQLAALKYSANVFLSCNSILAKSNPSNGNCHYSFLTGVTCKWMSHLRIKVTDCSPSHMMQNYEKKHTNITQQKGSSRLKFLPKQIKNKQNDLLGASNLAATRMLEVWKLTDRAFHV